MHQHVDEQGAKTSYKQRGSRKWKKGERTERLNRIMPAPSTYSHAFRSHWLIHSKMKRQWKSWHNCSLRRSQCHTVLCVCFWVDLFQAMPSGHTCSIKYEGSTSCCSHCIRPSQGATSTRETTQNTDKEYSRCTLAPSNTFTSRHPEIVQMYVSQPELFL